MEITQSLKAITKAIDRKEPRKVLTAVRLSKGRAVATNGKVLLMCDVPDGDVDGNVPADFIGGAKLPATLEVAGETATIANLYAGTSAVAKTVEGKYPDVDAVLPKPDKKAKVAAVFSVHVLEALVAAMKTAKADKVTLELISDSVPCPVTFHGTDVRGIIMPWGGYGQVPMPTRATWPEYKAAE